MKTIANRVAVLLVVASAMSAAPADILSAERKTKMSEIDCTQSPVARSRCMIQAILDDIGANYTHDGGGGISGIKLVATDKYTVSISQEERVDEITYDLSLDGAGKVKIDSKSSGTKSRDR